MVSTRKVYRIAGIKGISFHGEKGRSLGHHFANAPGGNTVTLESSESRFCGLRRDRDEQSARGLRVKEQVLILGRHAGCKGRAIAHESAVILESAGEMAFARCFDGSGEIIESRVIDLKRDWRDAVRGVTEGHLARMAEQTETGDVGDRVNAWRVA